MLGSDAKLYNMQSELFIEDYFVKKSKILGSNVRRFYRLQNKILYYSESSKSKYWKGFLVLDRTYVEFFEPNKQQKNINGTNNQFIIKLRSNKQTCELIAENKDQFLKWKQQFRACCFQLNFGQYYKSVKTLGQGSFGKVFIGEHQTSQVQYAIKAFKKEGLQKNDKSKKAVLNEILILQQLNHKNIIKIYECFEGQYTVYIVMQLVKGGELSNLVNQKKFKDFNEIRDLMQNLLLSLEYIHSKNIIHRDLKPQNIILKSKNSNSEIVLADFGLASYTNEIGTIYEKCGTPGYVAPEIYRFCQGYSTYDCKADIFSAGVIFMLLLTGKNPFKGKDDKETMKNNRSCNIQPYFYNQIENQDALDLIKHMLAQKPSDRYDAKQCLQHDFFKKSLTNISIPKGYFISQNINLQVYDKKLQDQKNDFPKKFVNLVSMDVSSKDSKQTKGVTDHLMYLQPAWNGFTFTLQDQSKLSVISSSKRVQMLQQEGQENENSYNSLVSDKDKVSINDENTDPSQNIL
ncbi:Protein kinase-like domain [Pseudocohnilembus persalinus]|uniref:non-specific serine/threonine protein kinase n=1 Tax=Pseudocohnilembus persalinus TaxID=266149 RepID=A0A0V0QXW3_PSEPJ|nr:Protein kinase-like domain [Pseudocohnilembus persalinus]|eukprot:KRX06744.1 Protein kinase-like domain [Pseudocohnilembus persalinus]